MKTNTTTIYSRYPLAIAVAITTISTGAAPAAVAVINGGFEDTTGMTADGNFYRGPIPGWTFSGLTAELATTSAFGSPAGVTGNNHLEAYITEPNHLGTLSQTVSGMTIGQDYVLTFDWGNRTDMGGDQDYEFEVSIAGQSFSQFGTTGVDMTQAQLPFTATNTSETIGITFYLPSSFSYTDGALDNFAITQVPEPSSSFLLGCGALTMILRRKRASHS